MKQLLSNITILTALSVCIISCNVEPVYYSQVSPETFFDSRQAVYQRFYRPFTHARWTFAQDMNWFYAQELGTDEFCSPVRGSQNAERDVDYKMHYHQFPVYNSISHQNYISRMAGVARCWATLSDLSEVNLSQFGFTKDDFKNWTAQLSTMAAMYYLQGLDLFGGLPLYAESAVIEKPRSTDKETFDFIEKLLLESIPYLEKKTALGGVENGDIRQGIAALTLARLYFNAESYIGKNYYSKAETICRDIIAGKYGAYALDEDWTTTFGFNNDKSKEILWSIPSERAQLETDAYYLWSLGMPTQAYRYLGGIESSSSQNKICLCPSYDGYGVAYDTKLGRPFAKFNEKDVRKKPYNYLGQGKYEGMFIFGEMTNPSNPSWQAKGNQEYSGQVLNIVDQIARLSEGKHDSSMETGEENSGVRLIKFSPRPSNNEAKYLFCADIPLGRLAEVYYMLAECRLRDGFPAEAATLINQVRVRYFKDGIDPDPCPSNMDKYRMLDEWMIEFLGECRRRTDLIRWNEYVEGSWWDHKADGIANSYLKRLPFSSEDIDASTNLKQNPGYSD